MIGLLLKSLQLTTGVVPAVQFLLGWLSDQILVHSPIAHGIPSCPENKRFQGCGDSFQQWRESLAIVDLALLSI